MLFLKRTVLLCSRRVTQVKVLIIQDGGGFLPAHGEHVKSCKREFQQDSHVKMGD